MDDAQIQWSVVRTWAEAELNRLREKNDAHCDELKTAALRGEIAFIKKFLRLPEQLELERQISPLSDAR